MTRFKKSSFVFVWVSGAWNSIAHVAPLGISDWPDGIYVKDGEYAVKEEDNA